MTSILNKYNNLTQRIITALFGAAIILGAAWYGPWTYFVVFIFICISSQLEFYRLSGLDGMIPLKTFGTFSGLLIFCLSFFIEYGLLDFRYYFLIFPVISGVYLIKLYKKFERKPFTNIAFTFLGIVYVAVPFSLLNVAVLHNGTYNYEIIIGILLLLWASDSGAYFAGVRFGKRKLFARVSPKKSWEGAVGGAVLAIAFALIISREFNSLPEWQWLVIAGIVIVGGIYGDLIESLLKRSIEIKDSGDSLPGHGGFLDRFDGLLISVPFIVAFLKIFA